jgi:GNAT superfamily N-acetyltransferase
MAERAVIRSATPADVPTILRFVRELAEFEQLLDKVTATEDDLRRSLFGPRPYAEVLLAEMDAPVGFALFFHNYSTFLGKPGIYLEDLYVTPGARGHGVGRALIEHVARVAAQRGCGRLEWAVLDWNRNAIAFYRSLGAEPMDDWTVYRVTGEALAALASRANSGKPRGPDRASAPD